jgi:hypothetical protein
MTVLDSGGEISEVTVDTGVAYRPAEPVLIRVRHREHRYDLGVDGAAVARAGTALPLWITFSFPLPAFAGRTRAEERKT